LSSAARFTLGAFVQLLPLASSTVAAFDRPDHSVTCH
jgi:hypothetical protein